MRIKDLIKNKDYDYIEYRLQLTDTKVHIYGETIFIGEAVSKNGKLIPLDEDTVYDEEDIAHYFGHSNIGSYYVLTNMYNPSEKCEDKDKFLLDCCFMINYHMFPFSWNTENINKKWKRRFGEYKYEMLVKFHECDKARVVTS